MNGPSKITKSAGNRAGGKPYRKSRSRRVAAVLLVALSACLTAAAIESSDRPPNNRAYVECIFYYGECVAPETIAAMATAGGSWSRVLTGF